MDWSIVADQAQGLVVGGLVGTALGYAAGARRTAIKALEKVDRLDNEIHDKEKHD